MQTAVRTVTAGTPAEGEDVVMEPCADECCEFLVVVEKRKKGCFCLTAPSGPAWETGFGETGKRDLQHPDNMVAVAEHQSESAATNVDVTTTMTPTLTASKRVRPAFRPTFERNLGQV